MYYVFVFWQLISASWCTIAWSWRYGCYWSATFYPRSALCKAAMMVTAAMASWPRRAAQEQLIQLIRYRMCWWSDTASASSLSWVLNLNLSYGKQNGDFGKEQPLKQGICNSSTPLSTSRSSNVTSSSVSSLAKKNIKLADRKICPPVTPHVSPNFG